MHEYIKVFVDDMVRNEEAGVYVFTGSAAGFLGSGGVHASNPSGYMQKLLGVIDVYELHPVLLASADGGITWAVVEGERVALEGKPYAQIVIHAEESAVIDALKTTVAPNSLVDGEVVGFRIGLSTVALNTTAINFIENNDLFLCTYMTPTVDVTLSALAYLPQEGDLTKGCPRIINMYMHESIVGAYMFEVSLNGKWQKPFDISAYDNLHFFSRDNNREAVGMADQFKSQLLTSSVVHPTNENPDSLAFLVELGPDFDLYGVTYNCRMGGMDPATAGFCIQPFYPSRDAVALKMSSCTITGAPADEGKSVSGYISCSAQTSQDHYTNFVKASGFKDDPRVKFIFGRFVVSGPDITAYRQLESGRSLEYQSFSERLDKIVVSYVGQDDTEIFLTQEKGDSFTVPIGIFDEKLALKDIVSDVKCVAYMTAGLPDTPENKMVSMSQFTPDNPIFYFE